MNKLFEVPYNFNESLIPFYKRYASHISYLFLPPYKDDLINTRTSIETRKKGRCYMPQSREEYEFHLNKIVEAGLRYVVLWQVKDCIITSELLKYYHDLNTTGFIIGDDRNAKVIKDYDSSLVVICSLVQRVCTDIRKKDFSNYDYVLLYYPFNRSLDALKELTEIRDKIVIMPNTLCHIDCPSIHHWFPSKERPFVQERDCLVLTDSEGYINNCGFISPEHLCLFDDYVAGYKLQGREYTTDLLRYICELYFKRKSPQKLLQALLGEDLANEMSEELFRRTPDNYYNVKTPDIIRFL